MLASGNSNAGPARHPPSAISRPPRLFSHLTGGVRAAAFTTIELVVIISIAGILAVVALPRMFDQTGFDTRGYFDQTQSMVRFAHKLAIAQRRLVFVEFTGSFKICSTPNPATCSCSAQLAPPTGAIRPLPAGVTLAAGTGAFCFDAVGRPLLTSLAPMAAANTVTVTGDLARNFVIEPETGYVH